MREKKAAAPAAEAKTERAKNIEAVKALLTPEEWAEIKEEAYSERRAEAPIPPLDTSDALLAAEALKTLKTLRYSIGRLYGHFNNVMLKWNITPLNSFNKPARAVSVDPEETEEREIPPVKKPTPVPPSPTTPKKRRTVERELAPPEEVKRRRNLMENQLKLRPSTLAEILARLKVEGFPVTSAYYSHRTRGRETRLQTLVSADLYLLMFNKVVLRNKAGLYQWIPNNGVEAPYSSRTATIARNRKKNTINR
jgi:hypothetical protein